MASLTLDDVFFLNEEKMFPHFKRRSGSSMSRGKISPLSGTKFFTKQIEMSLKNICYSRFINVLIINVSSSS
jgi:hypothetical protein